MDDTSFEAYRLAHGINASGLKECLKSPAHYQTYLRRDKPTTPAQRLGQLTHMAVLEPDRYHANVVVMPTFASARGMTLASQRDAWQKEQADDAVFVSEADHDHVRAIADGVHANATARKLLARGEAEQSVFWRDEIWQVACKARADFISRPSDSSPGVLVDLKTTRDASRAAFSRAVLQYRYDLQMAHYLAGGAATGLFGANDALLIAVETDPPHACVVYTMSEALLGVGVQWRDEAMSRYVKAVQGNVWPGYPEVDELGVARWAKVPGEEEEGLL